MPLPGPLTFLRHRFTPMPGATTTLLDLHLRKTLNCATGPVLLDIDLKIERGETVAILGPSGTGKTTLLRMIAGLTAPDDGRITAFGKDWFDKTQGVSRPPRDRRAGMVFQDYALFPNMSALGNVCFAQRRGRSRSHALALLERVGLQALAGQRPGQLSGGQQQRLALARALAAEPDVLLLDEPLSALDNRMRAELQDALLSMRQSHPTTTLLVTHDPAEARRLTKRAIVLEHGRIVADTTPARLPFPHETCASYRSVEGVVLDASKQIDGDTILRIACRPTAAPVAPRPGETVSITLPTAHIRNNLSTSAR